MPYVHPSLHLRASPHAAPSHAPKAAPHAAAHAAPHAVPRARRVGLALALVGAVLVLAACQSGTGLAPSDAWTEAEVAVVFDLSELGSVLTAAPDGDHLLLDGKALPREVLARFPHLTMGRSLDLLHLGDDALTAMAPRAAEFLLRAAPGELRAALADYGLDVAKVRAAWNDRGVLDLAGLHAAADRLDAAGAGVRAAGTGAGTRLLADLGVAR